MQEATRIIAIRHGETAWNVATRIQGHTDIDLNERGQWQAERAAMALADEPIHGIYASDLARAHATAQAIASHAARTQPVPHVHQHIGLRERGFGSFEGLTHAQIASDWPHESQRWKQRDPEFSPPGGESLLQLRQRVLRTLADLGSAHVGQQIVLVSHGGVMDMLYRLATGQTIEAPRNWNLGNATINRLLWTPHALTLVGWGDTRHLEDHPLDETTA